MTEVVGSHMLLRQPLRAKQAASDAQKARDVACSGLNIDDLDEDNAAQLYHY